MSTNTETNALLVLQYFGLVVGKQMIYVNKPVNIVVS